AIPIGLYFDLEHTHTYSLANHIYSVGPKLLIRLPASLASAIAFPDFSSIFSLISIKYIVMFSLVGSIESLLSVSAVDSLDPERRTSDMNKDLLAAGIGNTVAAALGGLPMISEIVRSKANIDNGAKSRWANFFHGLFLLAALVLIPGLLQEIPLAALAAMLIYTGFRLASPKEFIHAYEIGAEQLFLFVSTMVVTLATDLLLGVAVGLVLKVIIHLKNGASLKTLFSAVVREHTEGDRLILEIHESAIFTNYLALKARLSAVPSSIKTVELQFGGAWIVDHTVLEKLTALSRTWADRELVLTGLDEMEAASAHGLASRRRRRNMVAA
ncbi:MAG: SulP family inorganic anion transporter, partial [Acidobacteria bacterium]|nr:SulP family inorganic anion transporter [Acidobacteriota bacterium]